MSSKPVGVQITSSHPVFETLLGSVLARPDLEPRQRGRSGVAHILLDFPLTWAFRRLEQLDSVERARTLVATQASHPAYLDCLASYHVSGVVETIDDHALLSAVYGAAFSQRTYHWRSGLTYMELRVTRLLLLGHGTGSAAERLGISYKTVNAHVSNVLCKLGLGSRAQLLATMLGHADAWPAAVAERVAESPS
jgi:DNA-binding CsgD family transcriptional regulator